MPRRIARRSSGSDIRARYAARGRELARAREHTITAGLSAFALGFGEKKGWDFPTIPNVDAKLTYAAAALLAANYVKNARLKRIAGSVGDGLISVWAYSAGKTGEFGVGEDDVDV